MSSPIKAELLKIGALVVLLVFGVGYLLNIGKTGSADPGGVISPETDVSTLDSLRLVLEEHTLPNFRAYNVVTDQQENISTTGPRLIILVAGTTCAQRQVDVLRRIQMLHDTIGEDVPVRALIVTDLDAGTTRMRALLYRKAIRPTFQLWYTNDVNPLLQTVLSKHLEPVLLVDNHAVRNVFHIGQRNRIIHAVSQLSAPTAVK